MRVALSGLTMAEYFRDVEESGRAALHRQHLPLHPGRLRGVRHCWAVCPPPSATSPRWPPRWARCRSASPPPRNGSITSVQAVYVPADDLTDPAPATTFAHLDATTVLSREIARAGHLPGCGPAGLDLPHPGPGGRRARSTTDVARARAGRCCSATRSCRTSSPSWAWTSCREEDKRTVSRARKVQRFLSQPFHVAEQFTGMPGQYVPLKETLRGFKIKS